jgi:DNA-directed RNA polymerase specialized sigma subunit
MSNKTFIEKCIDGEALAFDIDDYLEEWHTRPTKQEVYDFLGMTKIEYNAWALDDSVLPYIIKAHKNNTDFTTINFDEYQQIAARNKSSDDVINLLKWIKDHESTQH